MTLTRSKVKVKVTGLLNFRQLAKPCMLAAMTAAPLRGFLVLLLSFRYSVRVCSREEKLKEGLLAAISVPLKMASKANALWPTLNELAGVANIACKSDLQVSTGHFVPHHHHTVTVLRPFFRDHPGEPVPEENFWTLWCKGRLTEADTLTIRLGATPSGLTSTPPSPIFYRPDALPATQPTASER